MQTPRIVIAGCQRRAGRLVRLMAAVVFAAACVLGSVPALAATTGLDSACSEAGALSAGGAHNVVRVQNPTGGDLKVRGSAQINHVSGPTAAPVNCALAQNGVLADFSPTVPPTPACVGCQSVAVALQIDLIRLDARTIAPRNIALAENLRCERCTAVALAFQYVLQVEDPSQIPPDAAAVVRSLDDELQSLQTRHNLSPAAAADEIVAVIRQFNQLAASLDTQRSATP